MSDWSPYALEQYRARRSRGGKPWVLGLLALLVLGWVGLNLLAGDSQFRVGTGGDDGSVAITPPAAEGPPKATVTVSPGKVTELDAPINAPTTGSRVQAVAGEKPFPILKWLLVLGPVALLVWLARRLLAATRTELNFGVYKGAMPLEMITAERDLAFPRKEVAEPLFGRTRTDYLRQER